MDVPDEVIDQLKSLDDWRARGLALVRAIPDKGEAARETRTVLLERIGQAIGMDRTSLANLVSLTRWLKDKYPAGIDPEERRYPISHAYEFRRLHKRNPAAADLIASEVFAGHMRLAAIRNGDGSAHILDHESSQDPGFLAGQSQEERELSLHFYEQSLHSAAADAVELTTGVPNVTFTTGFEKKSDFPQEFPADLFHLLVEAPGRRPALVRFDVLPSPPSKTLVIDVFSRALALSRYGLPVIVLDATQRSGAQKAEKMLHDEGIREAKILLIRFVKSDRGVNVQLTRTDGTPEKAWYK